jgi:tetratricopeptide (TPR) repeat protein
LSALTIIVANIAYPLTVRSQPKAEIEKSVTDVARQVQLDTLAGARPLMERALMTYEKELGPEHPDTAQSLNNLALLLHDQGDLAGARPLFERALAIYEKALGPEHPNTVTVRNNLAKLSWAEELEIAYGDKAAP